MLPEAGVCKSRAALQSRAVLSCRPALNSRAVLAAIGTHGRDARAQLVVTALLPGTPRLPLRSGQRLMRGRGRQ